MIPILLRYVLPCFPTTTNSATPSLQSGTDFCSLTRFPYLQSDGLPSVESPSVDTTTDRVAQVLFMFVDTIMVQAQLEPLPEQSHSKAFSAVFLIHITSSMQCTCEKSS